MAEASAVSGPDVRVVDAPERSRFEAFVGGQRAGFLVYELGPGAITLVHTEVDDAFGGRGVGGRLVADALRDVRQRGLQVVPRCPFVVRWMREHPDA
jgi:predicted GNAT family acetyltransferase